MCDRSLPLHRRFSRIHSQQLRRAAFGVHTPLRELRVPPSWFLTTSMVFSARKLQVCCALQPVMGFARVSRTVARCRACARLVPPICFPQVISPLEVFPLEQPYPVTRACPSLPLVLRCALLSLHAVSSATEEHPLADHLDFEVLLHSRVRGARHRFQWSNALSFRGLWSPSRFFLLFRKSIGSWKERFLARANPGSLSTEVQIRLRDHTLPTCGGGG